MADQQGADGSAPDPQDMSQAMGRSAGEDFRKMLTESFGQLTVDGTLPEGWLADGDLVEKVGGLLAG